MIKLFFASIFLAAALAMSPVFADELKINRIISLTGHGEVHMVPDMATVTIGVVSSAASAGEALAANTKAMIELMSSLSAANIAEKDIATSNFSVNPRLDYGQNNGQPPKVVGYDVSNNVTVTVRKIDGLGSMLDKAVSAGSNQINGISFSIANPEAALDEARKLAVKEATRKAKLYTDVASVSLGNVVSMSEGGGAFPPPMMMQTKAMSASDGAGPVPIAQGEQVIGADVNMSWEIK